MYKFNFTFEKSNRTRFIHFISNSWAEHIYPWDTLRFPRHCPFSSTWGFSLGVRTCMYDHDTKINMWSSSLASSSSAQMKILVKYSGNPLLGIIWAHMSIHTLVIGLEGKWSNVVVVSRKLSKNKQRGSKVKEKLFIPCIITQIYLKPYKNCLNKMVDHQIHRGTCIK